MKRIKLNSPRFYVLCAMPLMMWAFSFDLYKSSNLEPAEISYAEGKIEDVKIEKEKKRHRSGKEYVVYDLAVRLTEEPSRYYIDNGFHELHFKLLEKLKNQEVVKIGFYDGYLNFEKGHRIVSIESNGREIFPYSDFRSEISARSRVILLVSFMPIIGIIVLIALRKKQKDQNSANQAAHTTPAIAPR